jgi:hypothetical protein
MRQALLLAFIAAGVFITASCDDDPDPKCTGNSKKEDGDCVCQQA